MPGEVPADMALLGRLSRKALPGAVGVSPRRWANAKSLTLDALRRSGLSLMPGRRLQPRSLAWAELFASLTDPYKQYQLSRITGWNSAEGIEPADVDGATCSALAPHSSKTACSAIRAKAGSEQPRRGIGWSTPFRAGPRSTWHPRRPRERPTLWP
jgi:hypothetical protein